jgi:thiamine biosynthesis protein ThiS
MGRELRVKINGESRDISDQSTLSDLVEELLLSPARIAVELNGQVIRRTEWMQTRLAEGDRLEIVHFVGGGEAE